MFTKASIVTFFASLAAAQLHEPVGEPSGNPINRPLNENVPACKAFTIQWQPTTPNTVSLLLLKGPPTNVVKFGPAIAEGIRNSGSFVWTPSADLESFDGITGYGIQLIDDITGQYQYSTQFGISTDDCEIVSSSSTSGGYVTSTPVSSSSSSSQSGYATVNTTIYSTKSQTTLYSTGAPHSNTSVVLPTKSLSLSSSIKPTSSATTSGLPESTGAASSLQAGLGLVGAVAAFAFML